MLHLLILNICGLLEKNQKLTSNLLCVYIYIIQIYLIFKTIYKNNVFHVFSHLNSLIQNVLPQLKRKGKDNEKFRNDSTKKLLAR